MEAPYYDTYRMSTIIFVEKFERCENAPPPGERETISLVFRDLAEATEMIDYDSRVLAGALSPIFLFPWITKV
jgi:hypothetical protein